MNHKVLYSLEFKTGEIHKGVHHPAFRNNGEEILSRFYFGVEGERIVKIETDSYFLNCLDLAKVSHGDFGFEIGYSIAAVIQVTTYLKKGGTETKQGFYVFSTLEKAIEINKKYLLPLLLKEKEKRVNTAHQKYFEQVNEYSKLELLLSNCNAIPEKTV